jgi:hypothetical protein
MEILKKRLSILIAVCFIFGLVGVGQAKEIYIIEYESPKYAYALISVDGDTLWEVPMKEVSTVSKEEWRDIDMLIRLTRWIQSDKDAMKALIKTLSPKRFIRKAN